MRKYFTENVPDRSLKLLPILGELGPAESITRRLKASGRGNVTVPVPENGKNAGSSSSSDWELCFLRNIGNRRINRP
jgi:hypothetical protein